MKAYLVTTGTYSDYCVTAVFSSEEKAREFMNAFPEKERGYFNDLEEYELDPDTAQRLAGGYSPWVVRMKANGDVEHIFEEALTTYNASKSEYHIWRRYADEDEVLVANVLAKDEEHAIKIANEFRIQSLAENRW